MVSEKLAVWPGKPYPPGATRKGEGGLTGDLGYRLTGSSDLYEFSGRCPYASIDFITCHDGCTLHDLVSDNEKHNLAKRLVGVAGARRVQAALQPANALEQ